MAAPDSTKKALAWLSHLFTRILLSRIFNFHSTFLSTKVSRLFASGSITHAKKFCLFWQKLTMRALYTTFTIHSSCLCKHEVYLYFKNIIWLKFLPCKNTTGSANQKAQSRYSMSSTSRFFISIIFSGTIPHSSEFPISPQTHRSFCLPEAGRSVPFPLIPPFRSSWSLSCGFHDKFPQ